MKSTLRTPSRLFILAALLLGLVVGGCDLFFHKDRDDDRDDDETLDLALCDPAQTSFSLDIDNPYFPLPVGRQWTLEGEEDGEQVRVVATVFDETEDVAGVTTRVLEERETVEGELAEISLNYFAQAEDGTVCYFGEAVDNYEDGEIVSNEGAWRADDPGARAGIWMPAAPAVGQTYPLEAAPGEAEDMVEILALGETVTVPYGSFTETLRLLESNPLDGDESQKVYARGIGFLVDGTVELVGFTEGAGDGDSFTVTYDPSFDPATLQRDVTNPYYPLTPGTTYTFESQTEDGVETIIVEVLEETREVAGATTTVVRDRAYLDGELIEDTFDWYAQDPAGNVWYMGEDTKEYEDGEVVSTAGSWEAGVDGAEAGILMPAAPAVGQAYQQEFAEGEAEDRGQVLAVDASVSVPYGDLTGCVKTEDTTPLEPDVLENNSRRGRLAANVTAVRAA